MDGGLEICIEVVYSFNLTAGGRSAKVIVLRAFPEFWKHLLQSNPEGAVARLLSFAQFASPNWSGLICVGFAGIRQ